ncbi:MAG: hypothetical protein GXP30_00675 [Verrucomicrobia bacterium]|nr:hypothetical protein [Verrucomicrobiota bacterium]
MTQELEQFGRYLICQGSDGAPVTFKGVPNEMLCLAYDPETLGLVELHILPESEDYAPEAQRSFTERAWMASGLHSPCCCKILDVGNSGGLHYYTTEVGDGEAITSFVKRNGPLDTALTLALTIQLTDAIFQMQSKARLLQGLNLGRLQVVATKDSYLALQMADCSLASAEKQETFRIKPRKMISDIAQIFYYLLTASPYHPKGGDDQLSDLDNVPTNVKFILKHTLDPASENGPSSLADFRKELRDAYSAVSSKISTSTRFQPPPVPKRLLPAFRLQQKLFSKLNVKKEFENQYEITEGSEDEFRIYTETAEFLQGDSPVETSIQVLPRSHIWPDMDCKRLEENLAKIDPERHPYLLPVREIRETDQAILIVEEPTVGFSLPDILTLRDYKLEPIESIILLNYIRHAINQARENRIPLLGLSIYSVQIHFLNATQFRTRELQKRRIDHWPEFMLKLRCYPTTEGLIASPPAGRIESGLNRDKPPSADGMIFKNFIAITEQLVLGTHFEHGSIPDESLFLALNSLRKFLQEKYNSVNDCVVTFDLHQFLEELAELLESLQLSDAVKIDPIVDGGAGVSLPTKTPHAADNTVRESHGPALIGSNSLPEEAAMIDDEEFHEPLR